MSFVGRARRRPGTIERVRTGRGRAYHGSQGRCRVDALGVPSPVFILIGSEVAACRYAPLWERSKTVRYINQSLKQVLHQFSTRLVLGGMPRRSAPFLTADDLRLCGSWPPRLGRDKKHNGPIVLRCCPLVVAQDSSSGDLAESARCPEKLQFASQIAKRFSSQVIAALLAGRVRSSPRPEDAEPQQRTRLALVANARHPKTLGLVTALP